MNKKTTFSYDSLKQLFINLEEKDYQDYWAHTKFNKQPETLIEHLELTKVYLLKLIEAKGLFFPIEQMCRKIDEDNSTMILKLFLNAVYLHDIGKTNKYFQARKMKNPKFQEFLEETKNSAHSYPSAVFFIDFFENEFKGIERTAKKKLQFILYHFAYLISKHHGWINNFKEDKNLQDLYKKVQISFTHKFKIEPFDFYILNKLLFSLLVSSDYYATFDYQTDIEINDFGLFSAKDKKKFTEVFQNYYKKLTPENKKISELNQLRKDIFDEAEKKLLQNLDKSVFYLEAPTGSGKTLTSINLALQLLNKTEANKIFYVFPFNTLVEQTKNVFEEIFNNNSDEQLNYQIINSITALNTKEKKQEEEEQKQEEEETKYEKTYLARLFFHEPLIITTHVQLFSILFGTNKENNFPLWQLANSVIILDEIQSYDNNLWLYMASFFEHYAKLLNIKFIIMSATLPKIDKLIKNDDVKEDKKNNNKFISLLSNAQKKKFFENKLFRERVKIDFSLLENNTSLEITFDDLEHKLLQEVESYDKILFEFIKKQTARDFYNYIKENKNLKNFLIYELSGDDNKAFRQEVIEKSKQPKSKIIIVATQVIEAGVDIDMDIGFKDISTIDSEEQFLGRINRNSKKKNAKAYFFNLDDETKIYRGDNRIEFNLNNDEEKVYRKALLSKDFEPFLR